jgi:hypothetical protein
MLTGACVFHPAKFPDLAVDEGPAVQNITHAARAQPGRVIFALAQNLTGFVEKMGEV